MVAGRCSAQDCQFVLLLLSNPAQEDQTDSSSRESERSQSCERSSRHKELTDIGQILNNEGIVPVYWSASQLLSKLDTRQQQQQMGLQQENRCHTHNH